MAKIAERCVVGRGDGGGELRAGEKMRVVW